MSLLFGQPVKSVVRLTFVSRYSTPQRSREHTPFILITSRVIRETNSERQKLKVKIPLLAILSGETARKKTATNLDKGMPGTSFALLRYVTMCMCVRHALVHHCRAFVTDESTVARTVIFRDATLLAAVTLASVER